MSEVSEIEDSKMKLSFRTWFLIIVACAVLKLPIWITLAILFGYEVAGYFDLRQAKKARQEIADDLMFGWEPNTDDPEYEDKGDLSRVRLTGKDQILVARIAELIVRVL
jgi:hypothetical protein